MLPGLALHVLSDVISRLPDICRYSGCYVLEFSLILLLFLKKKIYLFGCFRSHTTRKNPPTLQEMWWSHLKAIPGSGRSPGGRRGNPLQCSCLEHPMDAGVFTVALGVFVASVDLLLWRSTAPEHRLWREGSSSCGMPDYQPRSIWDLPSPTRNQTRISCLARRILNHRTTREAPHPAFDMHIYHAAWVWAPGRIYVPISNARDCPVLTFIALFSQNVLAFSSCTQQPATNTSFDVRAPVEMSNLTGPLSLIYLKDLSQI